MAVAEKKPLGDTWEAQLAEAVKLANVPTLLMVLVQLTGDLNWMEAPYTPKRGRGLDE